MNTDVHFYPCAGGTADWNYVQRVNSFLQYQEPLRLSSPSRPVRMSTHNLIGTENIPQIPVLYLIYAGWRLERRMPYLFRLERKVTDTSDINDIVTRFFHYRISCATRMLCGCYALRSENFGLGGSTFGVRFSSYEKLLISCYADPFPAPSHLVERHSIK